MKRRKIISIVGTRPEVIKMAPVIKELDRRKNEFDHILATTAQHREMLDQVIRVFNLKPDIDLGLMQHGQTLAGFASRSLSSLASTFEEQQPDAILIQGDTTTVMTAALAAFYGKIKVGHVEAGLRSFDTRNPFPEEINRKVASCLTDLHFAPTERARQNLLQEAVPTEKIFVTGNTIVDALNSIPLNGNFQDGHLENIDYSRRVILVTAHRRENQGDPLKSICRALKRIVESYPDVEIVYPVHLNPNVSETVREELGGTDRIHLVDPVTYSDLLKLMSHSYMILSDSGGIQEEAPSFHKPILILRDVTERPEVVESGAGCIVGTDQERIVEETSRLLSDKAVYRRMSDVQNPFGDGKSAGRIVDVLAERI